MQRYSLINSSRPHKIQEPHNIQETDEFPEMAASYSDTPAYLQLSPYFQQKTKNKSSIEHKYQTAARLLFGILFYVYYKSIYSPLIILHHTVHSMHQLLLLMYHLLQFYHDKDDYTNM